MRRKSFDVLFEPTAGMAVLVKESCLWRSAFYFTLSVGFFSGVLINCWLPQEELAVRLGLLVATVIVSGTALSIYGFLLHGIMETFGNLAGNPIGLICLLGYTAMPFLLLTPAALLAGKMGLEGVVFFAGVFLVGALWMLYLLKRSLEAVYLVDGLRAGVAIAFSLLLMYIVFVFPVQLLFSMVLYKFG